MISKNEYEYVKIRIKKVESAIRTFESTSPIYRQYMKVQTLPPIERSQLLSDWEKYYRAVQAGPIGQQFKSVRVAFASKDSKTIQRIHSEMITGVLPKPRYEDPQFLDYKMSRYFEAKGTLSGLIATKEEYTEVFDKKRDPLDSF